MDKKYKIKAKFIIGSPFFFFSFLLFFFLLFFLILLERKLGKDNGKKLVERDSRQEDIIGFGNKNISSTTNKL